MEIGQLALLVVALLLTAFTLGALVAWRLEGRRPLVMPPWLIVTRHVSWLALAAYVVAGGPPAGVVAIDPPWWSAAMAFVVVASIVILAVEVRHALRRQAT